MDTFSSPIGVWISLVIQCARLHIWSQRQCQFHCGWKSIVHPPPPPPTPPPPPPPPTPAMCESDSTVPRHQERH